MENKGKILRPSVFSDYSIFIPNVFIDKEKLIEIINNIDANRTEYKVESEIDESGHRSGDGGEIEYRTLLNHNNERLLISKRFISYHTYSDDSEDFVIQDIKDTYVFGYDNLIKGIFPDIF